MSLSTGLPLSVWLSARRLPEKRTGYEMNFCSANINHFLSYDKQVAGPPQEGFGHVTVPCNGLASSGARILRSVRVFRCPDGLASSGVFCFVQKCCLCSMRSWYSDYSVSVVRHGAIWMLRSMNRSFEHFPDVLHQNRARKRVFREKLTLGTAC